MKYYPRIQCTFQKLCTLSCTDVRTHFLGVLWTSLKLVLVVVFDIIEGIFSRKLVHLHPGVIQTPLNFELPEVMWTSSLRDKSFRKSCELLWRTAQKSSILFWTFLSFCRLVFCRPPWSYICKISRKSIPKILREPVSPRSSVIGYWRPEPLSHGTWSFVVHLAVMVAELPEDFH